uniref:Uncharacterized protein n=1 Tax=Arundo donax TaxID=35708 RepID=A0A0A9A7Z5_ARUDO
MGKSPALCISGYFSYSHYIYLL